MNDPNDFTTVSRRRRVWSDERGQGLVEYALILALVSLAAIVALGFLSGKINSLFSKAGNSLNNVPVAAGGSGGPAPGPVPAPGTANFVFPGGGFYDDGDLLTVNTSGWSNGPTSYTFTWYWKDQSSCLEASPNWGSPIETDSGASPSATYQTPENPGAGDDAYRVVVTATNASGTSTTSLAPCTQVFD